METIQKTTPQLTNLDGLAKIKSQITALAEQCKNIIITNDASLEEAKELAKQAKKIETYIEEKRKEITKPLLDKKKQIDDFAKNLTQDLSEATKSLRLQIQKYEEEKERKRLEELRRLEEEKRKAEEELRKAQQSNDIVSQIQNIEKVNQIAVNEMNLAIQKTSSLREIWTFELKDLSKVPIEYLQLNEAAVRQAIRNGVREIPGIRIFKQKQLVVK